MKHVRSMRWLWLALLVWVLPAPSYAGVFISVGFAPPPLPVYVQPPCPEPGLMWVPGYWAYGPEGYYWVPGAWVPAPYEGALWTPPYWGWDGGLYMFHPGYWGLHVGYYGGINYGFGYMGIGFVGGRWYGHRFEYNTAVMHVDRRFVHDTYEDRAIVERSYVERGSSVAYSGGPGGIRHMANAQERLAERDQHMGRTSFQAQHMNTAMRDRSAYFNHNHGQPQNLAAQRPLGRQSYGAPAGGAWQRQPQYRQQQAQYRQGRPQNWQQPQYRQGRPQNRQPQSRPQEQSRPAPQRGPEPRGDNWRR